MSQMFLLPAVLGQLFRQILTKGNAMLTSFPVLADVSKSFHDIAVQLAGYAPAIFAILVVVLGYLYMSTLDDAQKALRVKEGMYRAVLGLVIIQLGVTLAATLATHIQ